MKFGKRKPPVILMITVAMLALLPVLAVLQYRWMGKVSEAERQRMQSNLREGASKFTQDFDREMARVFFGFQCSATTEAELGAGLAEAYRRWSEETAFPQLVSGIYLVAMNEHQQPGLQRVNPATGQLQTSDWTDNLAPLKDRLQNYFHKTPVNLSATEISKIKLPGLKSDGLKIFRNEFEPVQSDVPAFIIHNLPTKMEGDFAILPFQSRNLTIITLNLDYLKQEMIPQLAAKYFSGNSGLDYNLTILDKNVPQKIIYQTDTASVPPTETSDASANLFSVRLMEMNSVVRARSTETVEDKRIDSKKTSHVAVQVISSDSPELSVGKLTENALLAANSGKWQLLLQHRAGSLGAVVESARRRNLAISFGVLILLSISIALLIISTRRAKRLAEQQMEFVAGVSHELRTPLAVIRSAGENLADGVIDEKNQIKRYGSLIASEGRRLTEMVEQILEFSGIQSGKKNYSLIPTDVSDIIEHAIASCLPMIEEGGFELKKEIAENLPAVAADEAALSRSIQNLLTNALKYSDTHRVIELKAGVHKTARGQEVRLTVSDKGLGIAAEDLPHIFEPFYRGREAVASQIHGSGLGLSLVKQIIDSHQGRITVSSEAGKGSSFTIHLPVAKSLESGVWSRESVSETQLT
ncbi:MAG: HAMP domain-containing sensor histidine kinase [Acidobacteriota bacterium]